MPKISIIVPVYNVEKYLRKCIDSILNQTFKDFELILVDDGSTDSSPAICEEYKEKSEKIRVVHKSNAGLSSARNAGIDIAKGNFLGFVDSDDFIEKDMYETLYNDIKEYDAQVAVCGLFDVYQDKVLKNKYLMERGVIDNKTALKLVLESKILSVSAVNKLYSKDLFEKIRYPEGKTYEDAFVTPRILYSAKKIAYNPRPKYYYMHREGSITTSVFKDSDFCVIEAYKHHLDFVKREVKELEEEAMFRYLWAHMLVMDKLIKSGVSPKNKKYKEVLETLKSNLWFIIKTQLFSYRRKLGTIILLVSPYIYKKILLKNDKI